MFICSGTGGQQSRGPKLSYRFYYGRLICKFLIRLYPCSYAVSSTARLIEVKNGLRIAETIRPIGLTIVFGAKPTLIL